MKNLNAASKLKLPSSYYLALSSSGSLVASLGRKVFIADLQSLKRIGSWHPLSHPSHASFSHCESRLAVKNTRGEIVVLAIKDGSVLAHFKPRGHDEGAGLLFTSSDKQIVDASWSGFIRVRSTDSLNIISEFYLSGEMIRDVCSSANRDIWLFEHTPTTVSSSPTPSPYLTIWEWPLKQPSNIINSGFDIVYRASLSPCAKFIAVVGYDRNSKTTQLRLLGIDGACISSVPTTIGGTGTAIRWSIDSLLVAINTATGFNIFSVPTLSSFSELTYTFPSDIAFLHGGTSLIIGTWKFGELLSLSRVNT